MTRGRTFRWLALWELVGGHNGCRATYTYSSDGFWTGSATILGWDGEYLQGAVEMRDELNMKRVSQVLVASVVLCGLSAYGCNGFAYQGTPLHIAARDGDFERVKQLVESGVPVDSVDENGERAAWYAVVASHHDIAKFLIDNGSSLDYANNSGQYRGGLYDYPKSNAGE